MSLVPTWEKGHQQSPMFVATKYGNSFHIHKYIFVIILDLFYFWH